MTTSTTKLRLQKFLAECGVSSRRGGEQLIRAGKVSVNGKIVTELGTTVNPELDRIVYQGRQLKLQKIRLFAFHKPKGVVSTLADPHAKHTLKDFLKNVPERVYPVGRLDKDVFGLLLLTNDGDFAARLLHPRYGVHRVYWAVVEGRVAPATLKRLQSGIKLEDGLGKAKGARRLKLDDRAKRLFGAGPFLDRIKNAECTLIELTVEEGRNHFVKRMFSAVGHPVRELCRVRFGDFSLGELKAGGLREIDNSSFERAQSQP